MAVSEKMDQSIELLYYYELNMVLKILYTYTCTLKIKILIIKISE